MRGVTQERSRLIGIVERNEMKPEETVTIRPLRQEDAAFLCSIFKDNKEYYDIFFDLEPTEREIGILVIKKEHLHCGYGAESLLWLIEKSKADNVHRLLLYVNQDNARAIGVDKNFGFEIFAEEIIPQCNDAVNLAQYKMKLDLI